MGRNMAKKEIDGAPDGALTDEQRQQLIVNLLNTRGDEGANEEEIVAVVRWAEKATIDGCLVNLCLEGKLQIDIKQGEVCFKRAE